VTCVVGLFNYHAIFLPLREPCHQREGEARGERLQQPSAACLADHRPGNSGAEGFFLCEPCAAELISNSVHRDKQIAPAHRKLFQLAGTGDGYCENCASHIHLNVRKNKSHVSPAIIRQIQSRMRKARESNREADFIRAQADAFGIDYTPGAPISALKDKIEFVLHHAGVMVVYDEFHFAIPISYHKSTPPRRLNWVRSKVIDQNVPCAFFATPQSYDQTVEKYVKTTDYRVEQWLGRLAPAVILSDVIPFEEILAVARLHFPELTQEQLEEMTDRAILSASAPASWLVNATMPSPPPRMSWMPV